jgi:uncharacterized protein (TIGR02145 family)
MIKSESMKAVSNLLAILLVIFVAFISCKKESKPVTSPVVTTYAPEFVASTVITVGFRVESDGGSKITDCGLYIGNAPSPETLGNKIQVASDTGSFYLYLSGLNASTQYYLKAYAINAKGTGLGEQVIFTTPAKIADYENNYYETVTIGTQSWMSSNLKTVHYMNGDPIISTVPVSFDISGESTPKYQWSYNGDDLTNYTIYGKLYTYYAVTDSRKICPVGWHVPTDNDWITLENYLGGANYAGSFLKESGNNHWIAPYNTDAYNITLFTALPGGTRSSSGTFSLLGNYGYFWSTTEADASTSWARSMFVQSSQVKRENISKKNAASVRCIKD